MDTRALTPEQRLAYEMTLSANALAVKNERKKMAEAEVQGAAQREQQPKAESVERLLKRGKLTIEEIAEDSGVSINYVLDIQRSLNKN